ncbi:MAG: STAS domain-containing protein [Bdellovibrionia bacterium]
MQVKIDTKEKIHVISIIEANISANMTEGLRNSLLEILNNPVRNVVLSLKDINTIDDAAAAMLINVQQLFYEQNCSFVICNVSELLEESLDDHDFLEVMNVVPTISEAGDIVQMEEIERDLIEGDEDAA